MEFISFLGVIVISYLLGSIPSGYIAGKIIKGVDIRDHGSGNIGFTNVFRLFGTLPGILVLIADIGKGFVAVFFIAKFLFVSDGFVGLELLRVFAGVAVIAGNIWTVFLGFRGGKGVATSTGVFLGLMPHPVWILAVVWGGIVAVTRYVSLGSMAAAVLLPILFFIFDAPLEYLIFGVLAAVFVIYKHKSNVRRLIAGTENKFGKRVKITTESGS